MYAPDVLELVEAAQEGHVLGVGQRGGAEDEHAVGRHGGEDLGELGIGGVGEVDAGGFGCEGWVEGGNLEVFESWG